MRRFVWLLALTLLAADSPTIRAQTRADSTVSATKVEATVGEAVAIRRSTQEQQDSWATERAELVQRYRQLKTSVARLSEYRETQAASAAELQAKVDELARRLQEADRFEAGLQDTLLAIFDRLDAYVRADLPFLLQERSDRLQSVRTQLVRVDVDAAEKLRRLLEALLIEARYGDGTEVYEKQIDVAGDALAVRVLRLGRLALFWRTPDGKRAGTFDRANAAWVELDGAGRRAVNNAMDMADRRRPHEVIALPLGRIVP